MRSDMVSNGNLCTTPSALDCSGFCFYFSEPSKCSITHIGQSKPHTSSGLKGASIDLCYKNSSPQSAQDEARSPGLAEERN